METEIEIEIDTPETDAVAPLESLMPDGFNLPVLLRFLPDVQLKRQLDTEAAKALGLEIVGGGAEAVERADAARAALKDRIAAIEAIFADPCSLANTLHKRLTGLRADFVANGKDAVELVGKRIVVETKRLDAARELARRQAQEEADRIVREQTRKAAREAEASGAQPEIVQALTREAAVATAAPVASPFRMPVTAASAPVQRWKARLVGTDDDAEPNPDVSALTAQQQASLLTLLDAIRDGKAPLSAIAINWPALNARAKADKTTFSVPGVEAFDEGGLRTKARR